MEQYPGPRSGMRQDWLSVPPAGGVEYVGRGSVFCKFKITGLNFFKI